MNVSELNTSLQLIKEMCTGGILAGTDIGIELLEQCDEISSGLALISSNAFDVDNQPGLAVDDEFDLPILIEFPLQDQSDVAPLIAIQRLPALVQEANDLYAEIQTLQPVVEGIAPGINLNTFIAENLRVAEERGDGRQREQSPPVTLDGALMGEMGIARDAESPAETAPEQEALIQGFFILAQIRAGIETIPEEVEAISFAGIITSATQFADAYESRLKFGGQSIGFPPDLIKQLLIIAALVVAFMLLLSRIAEILRMLLGSNNAPNLKGADVVQTEITGLKSKLTTLAGHLAQILSPPGEETTTVAGIPPDPEKQDYEGSQRGWCVTVKRIINEIQEAFDKGMSKKQFDAQFKREGITINFNEILDAIDQLVSDKFCDDHWGDFNPSGFKQLFA
jgi:hypothetical protein